MSNVVQLFKKKPPQWFETFNFTELKQEQFYIRAELKRCRRLLNAASKLDPRGALGPEQDDLMKNIEEWLKGYDYVLNLVQNEMIKRMKEGR